MVAELERRSSLSTLDHDFLMDSDVLGSDATNSSLLGSGAAISSHDFNMGSCSSSTIVSRNLSNVQVDSLNYKSLADVLAAVESLKKNSLISLAQAHSITFPLKCTVTNLRNIISKHLSDGSCASGRSQVKPPLQPDQCLTHNTTFIRHYFTPDKEDDFTKRLLSLVLRQSHW